MRGQKSAKRTRRDRDRENVHLRDLSCLLLCSEREKALEQYWHLYFLSGADWAFRAGEADAGGRTLTAAAGMAAGPGVHDGSARVCRLNRVLLGAGRVVLRCDMEGGRHGLCHL